MKHRRTARLVLLITTVAIAAVGIAVAGVAAFGPRADERATPRADERATPTDRVPVTGRESAVARAPSRTSGVRWSNPVRGEPDGATVSDADVATVEFDEVRLLDLATGAVRWRAELPGLTRPRAVFTANRVIVATRDHVVLLDRATGRTVGAAPFAEAAHLAVTRAPDGADIVVAANLDGALVGVDVVSAAMRWSRSYPGSIVDPLGAAGGLVVANWDLDTDTAMRVLSATTGEVLWDLALGSSSTPPAIAGGRVFVAAGETDGEAMLVGFDARTGRPLWSGRFPAPWDQSGAPVVADDTLYLVDRVGTVTAVDVVTGQPRWQTRTHTSVLYARMVATARAVIFQTFDDHVVAVDRATGTVLLGTSEEAFPIDVDATGDTLVVALRRGTPSRIEARPAP